MRYGMVFSVIALVPAFEPTLAADATRSSAAPLETVSVSASRISRDGYESPTPTTVLGAEHLASRAPDTLANALTHLPQMRNAANEGTGSLRFGQSAGRGFVNLRGLGTNRTLVLLDGERPVSNSLSGERDILSFPSALITRVDVVTGGASASYGSDAIAGVVNFILDSRFSGFNATAEGGTSAQSDATLGKITAAWGADLSDRWHLIASAELFERDGLAADSRSFATPPAIVPNTGFDTSNGQRPLQVVRNAYDADQAPGGLILNGPLAGQQFLSNGATAAYVPSSCRVSQPYVLCDSRQDLAATLGSIALTSPQRRVAGFGRLTFQSTPRFEAHFDALLARTRTSITSIPLETSEFGLRLPIDVAANPFLPEAVRAQYFAAGESTLFIGRQNTDQGTFEDVLRESVASFSAGLRAQLDRTWMLKVSASYGQADTGERWVNAYSTDRFLNAVDTVAVNGMPVCRINSAAMTDPACAPANIFGSGNMSADAMAYFLGTIRKPLKTYQHGLSVDLTGEPLSLWARSVSVAAGASYREERARQFNDGVDGGFAFIGYPPFYGETDVSEVYAQAVVPLAEDVPFARSIEAELAARWVHYSQAGSEVPWKVGLNWVPVPGVRIRFSKSEDIRAPNVLESSLPQFLSSISPQVNPAPNGVPLFNSLGIAPGQTLNVRTIGGGNRALTPEIAHTTAIGLVLEPGDLPGFRASIDHFRIRVRDAITTLPASTIVQNCAAGAADQCELIGLSKDSTLPTVTTLSVNAQSFETGGLDVEARYSFAFAGGEATTRALANYLLEYEQTVPGAPTQDLLGDISYGLPKLQADVSFQFTRGETTALLSGIYIGEGSYRNSLAADIQNDHVPAVWYVNAAIDRRLSKLCSVYASVSNVLDRSPPHPGFGVYTNIDSNLLTGVPYDRIGRFFKVGLRVTL